MSTSDDTSAAPRAWHDMGGTAAGAIDQAGHDFALWEKRVDALQVLCAGKGLYTVDGLRRALEGFGEDAFERMSYYERWIRAIAENLIEAGVLTTAELNARMEEVAARGATYGAASLGSVSEQGK